MRTPAVAATDSGRRARGGAKRVKPSKTGQPDVIARRNRATGVQVARRHPGEVAARAAW
jgi:hypothetical protein